MPKKVTVVDESGIVQKDADTLHVERIPFAAASSGNNTIVAAVPGKKIRVLGLFLISAGAVNVRWESGADGTALTASVPTIASSGYTLPESKHGWFETETNTLLNLELSADVSVGGCLMYVEV